MTISGILVDYLIDLNDFNDFWEATEVFLRLSLRFFSVGILTISLSSSAKVGSD